MKVSVDSSRCEAHGMCEASDPEFFTLDEDGYSSIGLDKEVLAAQENQVRLGVQSCPMGALSISDD
ncbi:ferredoxin [Mycobacterium vicinigordonae]|uniref:Ferredoxin n=2 Tax=Mycobacterium vicinigordonae TaxID=1719132 RepID=A0A7D6E3C1_9MYCO|nr:ferredoxin [Mycobacterium vicinigordonae]QLL09790.1 ferredoxin [Mycobacterium vicinigordonae]